MSFQTRKTFVHFGSTNEDFLDVFRELSDPPIDREDPNMINVQKHSKDIVKIICDISGSTVNLRILFVCKENKNNDFIQQFLSSASHLSTILLSITYVFCSVSAAPYTDTLFTLFPL